MKLSKAKQMLLNRKSDIAKNQEKCYETSLKLMSIMGLNQEDVSEAEKNDFIWQTDNYWIKPRHVVWSNAYNGWIKVLFIIPKICLTSNIGFENVEHLPPPKEDWFYYLGGTTTIIYPLSHIEEEVFEEVKEVFS